LEDRGREKQMEICPCAGDLEDPGRGSGAANALFLFIIIIIRKRESKGVAPFLILIQIKEIVKIRKQGVLIFT
jgi:hypothetical protein